MLAPYEPASVPERFARSSWFRQMRFGVFIHWGVYSLLGRGEWVRSHEEMSLADYQPWVDSFNPQEVDFDVWADAVAASGAGYAILTAKHHDGYCLFDSALTDYSSARRGPRRDFVAEFLRAFRRRGLKVGLYFSLIDWSHPDYPTYGDRHHPERNNPDAAKAQQDFDRYLDFMHAQVAEICQNYGDLDILWFDFAYDQLRGEAWRGSELIALIRRTQPHAIIDNRIEESAAGFGSIATDSPTSYCGDFVSPEQVLPPRGVFGQDGLPLPWEACVTLNNHWAWHAEDDAFKSPQTIIRTLVEAVSKGGNLLLNVGPDGQGVIPDSSKDVLAQVGAWIRINGESIHGAGPSALPKPEWGRWTQRGHVLYGHIFEQPIGPLPLPGVAASDIESVRWLASGQEIAIADTWVVQAYSETSFLALSEEDPAFTLLLPDPLDSVVEVTLRSSAMT